LRSPTFITTGDSTAPTPASSPAEVPRRWRRHDYLAFGGSSIDAFPADGNEDIRRAVNDAITGQAEWTVVDFAAALADPDDRSRLAAAFDSGDGVHPGDADSRALAGAVDLAMFK
jgi:hypothetical protein